MVARTVRRRTPSTTATDPGSAAFVFERVAEQWSAIKSQSGVLKDRQDMLRESLLSHLEEHGEVDDKGGQVLVLEHPVKVGAKEASAFVRQRRAAASMDEDKVTDLLAAKGLLARAQKAIVVLDTEEVYVMHQEGLITEKEIDDLITEKVTWALVPVTS